MGLFDQGKSWKALIDLLDQEYHVYDYASKPTTKMLSDETAALLDLDYEGAKKIFWAWAYERFLNMFNMNVVESLEVWLGYAIITFL